MKACLIFILVLILACQAGSQSNSPGSLIRDLSGLVVDPTGAGDSFAGGFFGYLASQPEITLSAFKRAMFYGGVMGSFACEKFGTERLQQLSREEIDQRFSRMRELSHLD